MKKIGIIGSGVVGKTLAKGFLQYGYDTTIASRSTEKRLELQAELGNNIHVADFASTAQNADMVVLAVKGTKAKEAMLICGLDNLHGKTIIDATVLANSSTNAFETACCAISPTSIFR